MKKLLLIIVALVILIPVGVIFSLDSIIKAGVEKGGSFALDTETTLESASISLTQGNLALENLAIAAPKGFNASPAFKLRKAEVQLDVGSLNSDTIKIDHIDVISPQITIEMESGGTNIGAFLDRLESLRGKDDPSQPAPEPTQPEAPADAGAGKGLEVGTINIRTATVHLELSEFTGRQTLQLGSITLNDVGQTDLAGVFEKTLGAILVAVSLVDGSLPKELQDLLKAETATAFLNDVTAQVNEGLNQVTEGLSEAGKQLEDTVEGAGKQIGDTADDIKKGLEDLTGGLFGSGKDKGKKKDQ